MLAIGSDHGGFGLKSEIIKHLQTKGIQYKDFGTFEDSEAVDYPEYAKKVTEAIVKKQADIGIVICGTGIGVSIVANKMNGIRCALCTNATMARLAKEHNDANVLALGQRIIGIEFAIDIVDAFLEAEFQQGRHSSRVEQINLIEKQNSRGRE